MPIKITSKQLDHALQTQEVSPVTGLAGAEPVKPKVTSQDLDRALQYTLPAQQFGQGDLRLDPNRFDFQLRSDDDNLELRAQNQSVGEHAAHGIGRLVGTTGTKLGSSVGFVMAMPDAIATGDINYMLDNTWSNMFNDLEEGVKEALPIHHTQKYLTGNVWEQMGTLGFWSDDVVDGAAFMAQGYLSGLGIGAIAKGVSNYGRIAKALSATTRAAKTGRITDNLIKAKKLVEGLEFGTITAFNTATEAAFEAQDTKKQVLETLADRVKSGEMTQEEAHERATTAARNTFWLNAGSLMLSNAVETSMMFKKYDFFRLPTFNQNIKALKPLTRTELLGAFGKNALLSSASEGLYEENIQSAIQDYNLDKAQAFNQNSTIREMFTGIAKNMVDNFGTDEGQKAIVLGSLIGLIPGGLGGASQAKQDRARDIAMNNAYGTLLETTQKEIGDVYKRDPETGYAVLDENYKPVLDEDKIQAKFAKLYNTQVDFLAAMKAAASGNAELFDFIRERRFSEAAMTFLALGNGQQVFEDWIDSYAETEKENLIKAGMDPAEAGIDDMAKEYKDKARKYQKIWSSIQNNYGGLFDFGKGEDAQKFKNRVIVQQFNEAVTQNFWETKRKDIVENVLAAPETEEVLKYKKAYEDALEIQKATGEPIELIDPELVYRKPPQALQAEKVGKDKVRQITALLDQSYNNMKDLLDENKQRSIFEAEKKELEDLQKEKSDTDIVDPEKSDINDSDPTKENRTEIESADKVKRATNSFTESEARANGYQTDLERSFTNNLSLDGESSSRPSVYYKDVPNGGRHYVFTDADNNVVKDSTVYEQELKDPQTDDKYKLGLTFKDAQLKEAKIKDLKTDKSRTIPTPLKEDGSAYTLGEIMDVFEAIPEFTKGLELTTTPDNIRFMTVGTKKKLSEITEEVEKEVEDATSELAKHIEKQAKKLQDELNKTHEKTMQNMELEGRDMRSDYLKKFYGDKRYNTVTPQELFGEGVTLYLPVIYNNVPGILQADGGSMLFTETIVRDGKVVPTGKSIIVSGTQSTETLEDLGIMGLRDLPVDITIESDGRPYPINIYDKYYRAATLNPTDSIETDPNGNPIAVNLTNSKGKNIRITTPHIVESLAYFFELHGAVSDKIFKDYFTDDLSDFVITPDPSTGEEIIVYRKNGKYVMFRENGKRMRANGAQYKRVASQLDNEINKAADALVKQHKYDFNSKRKDIQDELARTIQNIRPATPEEALESPDEREVQTPEAEEVTGKVETDSVDEKEIAESAAKEAAVKEEIDKQVEDQKKQAAIDESAEEQINEGTSVETIDADEVHDEGYVTIIKHNKGIKHSATAVSYIHTEDGKFVNRNPEFSKHIINEAQIDAFVIPELDLENEYFEDKPELKAELEKGNLSDKRIAELLTPKKQTIFTSLVDEIPLSITYEHAGASYREGLYYHGSDYSSVRFPASIFKKGMTEEEKNEAMASYLLKVKAQTRKARTFILGKLLKGESFYLPVVQKSMGTPNNTGENKNLGDVLKKIDPKYNLNDVKLGVASKGDGKKGIIYTEAGNVSKKYGQPGNIFLFTNHTANGQEGVFKLNASKLTLEHARILYEAFRQTYAKGEGGAKGKYVSSKGKEVTGGLTRDEVINILVRQGKKFTQVKARDVANQHLIPKQLWVDDASVLRFGTDSIPLHNPTKEELQRFYDWATTTKNYTVHKNMFGKKLKNRNPFTIGSTISYDPAVDNYNSMIIKSSMVLTDLDVVEGTKSLTDNPALSFDIQSAGIDVELTPKQEAQTKVSSEKVIAKSVKTPKAAPKVEKKPVEDKKAKKVKKTTEKVIKQVNKQATESKKGELLSSFKKVYTMPVGSVLYTEQIFETLTGRKTTEKKKVADIVEKNGRPFLQLVSTGGGMPGNALRKFMKKSEFEGYTDQAPFINSLIKDMNDYAVFLKYNSPTVKEETVDKQEETYEKETRTETPPTVEASRGRKRPSMTPKEEKAVPETPKVKPTYKKLDIKSIDDIGDLPFRERSLAPKYYSKENIDKAVKWLKNRFKNVDIEVIDGLIHIAGDRHAFGQITRDSIRLATELEVGSQYHEAFHRVSLLMLTEDQRAQLYNEARKEYNLGDMADKQVEEVLAEKFRTYVMRIDEQREQEKGITGWIKKAFRWFKQLINRFFGPTKMSEIDINTLFSDIETGRYYRQTIDPASYEALRGQYVNFEVKGVKLNMVQTDQEFREVVHSLFYLMARANNLIATGPDNNVELKISNLEDIKNLKYPPLFEQVEYLRDAYLSVADNTGDDLAAYREGMTKDELAKLKIDVFKDVNFPTAEVEAALEAKVNQANNIGQLYAEIFDNKQAYAEALEDFLMDLNIKTIRPDSDLSMDELLNDETGETRSDLQQFDKIKFESSSKDNTAANIKFLLSVLPLSNERSELTGLIRFSEFSPTWSKIMRDLEGFTTTESMIALLRSKSDGNMPYKVLLEHLEKDENLKTQFYRTMKKQRLDFINALIELVDDKPQFRFGSAAVRTAGAKQAKEWNQTFKRGNLFTSVKGEKDKVNADKFFRLSEQFTSLHMEAVEDYNINGELTGFEDYKTRLLDLLDSVGITLDEDAFNYILNDINREDNGSALIDLMLGSKDFKTPASFIFESNGTLYKLFSGDKVFDDKKRRITFENAFLNERSIRYLGNKMAESSPVELGDSVFGARGNRYYTIMQHTQMSNEMDLLKADSDAWLLERLSATYNVNSEFLRQLMEDPENVQKFRLRTLAAAVREDESDTGREYQAVTDLEDYLLRLSANDAGLLTPPTPADRRFYYFYSGLEKLDMYFDENGEFPEHIIDVFEGYAKDEYNRALLVREQVDEVIKGTRPASDLFENLHFKYVGDKKPEGKEVIIDGKLLKDKEGKYQGGGAHFTHFVDFNATFGKTDYRAGIKQILEDRLQDEIKKANQLGIIRTTLKDGKKVITENVLVADTIIDKSLRKMGITDRLEALENVLADNMVNQMMASIETNKLFIGDPASYKSFEDQVKRITGFTSTGDNTRNDIPEGIYENDELIRSGEYNVATFSSYEFTSPYYKAFVEKYKKALVEEGLATEKEAAEQAALRLRPYTQVDQTDAQTLITPEMYRAVAVKLGEWNDVKEQAYNILQSGRELTAEDYGVVSQVYFQPLKMTYVQTVFKDGVNVPIYDKMSMATLFRPIVKGTMMEDLVDRMETKGKYEGQTPIHQIKFHTAHKVGIRDRKEFLDANGKIVDLNTVQYYPQMFDNLRMQMVTDPHAVKKTDVGTQFKKVAIANVDLTGIYEYRGEKIDGASLVVNVHEVLGELSNRGVEDFEKDLHLKADRSVSNVEDFVERLKKEAKTAGLPDYIIETFKVDETTGEMYLNLDSIPGGRKWTQSRIISLIKKATIDLKMPGNVFIQMSNIGLRSIKTDDSLRLMDGNGYIEAQISVSIFKDVIPNYENISHEDRVAYLEKNPDLTAMGYRIPTQGQSSTYALNIVKFLPETVGDVIVLPAEGTALGGFDFDIDKLYVIRRNYGKDGYPIEFLDDQNSTLDERFDIYVREEALKDKINQIYSDYSSSIADSANDATRKAFRAERDAKIDSLIADYKTNYRGVFENKSIYEQNIRPALENRFLDMVFAVQLSDKHFVSRTQPLGYGAKQLSNLSKIIRGWEGVPVKEAFKSLEMVSPQYQLDVKSRYKFGQQGLGAFALANVHHAIGQLVELGLFDNIGLGNTVKYNGESVTDLSARLGKDNEYITEWFSALIDAHVDIAADPYIYYLNTNSYTRDVITLLLRAGTGGIPTFTFISQPILKEVALQYENKDNKIGVDIYKPDEEILEKYQADYERITGSSATAFDPANIKDLFDEKNMENDIKVVKNGRRTADFLQRQIHILQAFQHLQNYASALTEATLSSRIDTKKFGNNTSQISVYNARLKKALDDERDNNPSKGIYGIRNFSALMEETYLGPLTKNGIGLSLDVLSKLTLEATPAFRALHETILENIGRRYTANDALVDFISNEIFTSISGEFLTSEEGANLNEEDIKELIFGEQSVPKQVYDIKAGTFLPKHKNNALIRAFTPVFEQDRPDFLMIFKPDNKWAKDSFVRAWRDLLQDTDEDAKNFAYDLMYYSWITSGFKNTLHSFFDLIPPEMLKVLGYDDYIKDKMKIASDPNLFHMYMDDVYRNGWSHPDLVPEAKKVTGSARSKDGATYLLKVQSDHLNIGQNLKGEQLYVPYVKRVKRGKDGTKDISLFKYAGYIPETLEGVYYAVDKKSYYNKGYVLRENGFSDTVFGSNRVKAGKGLTQYLNEENINDLVRLRNKSDKLYHPSFDGFVQIRTTDQKVKTYNRGGYLTDAISERKALNIETLKLDESVIKELPKTGNSSTVLLKEEIDNGFYKLENGNFIFVEKIGSTEVEREAKFEGKMSFDYGKNKRKDVTSGSTLQAIKKGERTATTRYESQGSIDYWKKAQIGDVIRFKDDKGDSVLVEVTKALHKLEGSGKTPDAWSKLEGWSKEYFNQKVKPKIKGAWQIEYKVLQENQYLVENKGTTQPTPEEIKERLKKCK